MEKSFQKGSITMKTMNLNKPQDKLLFELKERAKELNCLYLVQETLLEQKEDTSILLNDIISVIPDGFQFPEICVARIAYENYFAESPNFKTTPWVISSNIEFQDRIVGKLEIFYLEERPQSDYGPFLKEEQRLIDSITNQIGSYFFHRQLKAVFEENKDYSLEQKYNWWILMEMLHKTNPQLLIRIAKKMVTYLVWKGIREANDLYEYFAPLDDDQDYFKETNYPHKSRKVVNTMEIISKVIKLNNEYLSENEIFENVTRWIKEDQSGFMVHILGNLASTFEEISTVIERYHFLKNQGLELSDIRYNHFKTTLIRRLLSDDPTFVNIAKQVIRIDDFHELINQTVYPHQSHGKYGGKSAGFLVSKYILKRSKQSDQSIRDIRYPKTWYILSDGIMSLIRYNQMEDITEQKYKSIEEVRKEYSYVTHVFKNATFPPELTKSLSAMLDDFGEVPLVIRSTSLLEDRPNAIFAGKYKSLFIANVGTKSERMEELINAITEVYASTFGPDPIEYRMKRGLVDSNEEMGIMVQEVIGKKIGQYFFPAFAGVAFSHNNYRWSNRILLEDGLLRLVPGLGTRAVDRLSDDYPVLISPGKPNLRVNASNDEIIRYSPKFIDVIDLENRVFKTVKLRDLIKEHGSQFPIKELVLSEISHGMIQRIRPFGSDFEKGSFIVSFDGLINDTKFVKQIKGAMDILENEFGYPVDLEFVHNGEELYLLQCRKQSNSIVRHPGKIPSNIPPRDVLFTAEQYISNGTISNINHIVYIDPEKYSSVETIEDLRNIGTCVGLINDLLPKRQYILMGPGRWGSRGDIKLGVSVTYSQICNTAMLIEIARQTKDYVPELSFGTHFFQDLVESNILYLPLYPDNDGIVFNEDFFNNTNNLFPDLLPKYAAYKNVIKVIKLSEYDKDKIVNVVMNEEKNMAVAYLSEDIIKEMEGSTAERDITKEYRTLDKDFHWKWRLSMAQQIAGELDAKKFGVVQFYIFGSVKNANSAPKSDIDILVHFRGTSNQKEQLMNWLDGWSRSLDYINYLNTGFKIGGMLDVHIITDEDIENRTSYAVKINAISDAARPLEMGELLNV
jgi:predicted nucleotidyltransferase